MIITGYEIQIFKRQFKFLISFNVSIKMKDKWNSLTDRYILIQKIYIYVYMIRIKIISKIEIN